MNNNGHIHKKCWGMSTSRMANVKGEMSFVLASWNKIGSRKSCPKFGKTDADNTR